MSFFISFPTVLHKWKQSKHLAGFHIYPFYFFDPILYWFTTVIRSSVHANVPSDRVHHLDSLALKTTSKEKKNSFSLQRVSQNSLVKLLLLLLFFLILPQYIFFSFFFFFSTLVSLLATTTATLHSYSCFTLVY